jgi:hypothetical protein
VTGVAAKRSYGLGVIALGGNCTAAVAADVG